MNTKIMAILLIKINNSIRNVFIFNIKPTKNIRLNYFILKIY